MHAAYAPDALLWFGEFLLEKRANPVTRTVQRSLSRLPARGTAARRPAISVGTNTAAPAAAPAAQNTGGFFGNTFASKPVGPTATGQNAANTKAGKILWNEAGTPGGHQGGFSNLWGVGKGMQGSYSAAAESGKGMWDSTKAALGTGQSMIRALHPDQVRTMRNAGMATGAAGLAGLGAVGSFVF